MAAILLLPGEGGIYTSAVITALTAATVGADTIDCTRCGQLAIQLGSGQGGGTIQMQQSFLGSAGPWANFGSAITLTSTGPTTLLDITDGPFGMLRFTSTLTAGTAQVNIIGFPIQRMF